MLDDFLTTLEMAELWGFTQREIRRKAQEGQIEGAVKVAGRWFVPVAVPWLKIREQLGIPPSVPWTVVRDSVTLSCEVGK